MGVLLVAVRIGLGLQLLLGNRGTLGAAVFPCVPCLGRGEIGASHFQGLLSPPVVVVHSEAYQEPGNIVEVFWGVGIEGRGRGLAASFVPSLGFRMLIAARDAPATTLGQENLRAGDVPAASLVEREPVAREQHLRNAVLGELLNSD